MWDAPYLHGLLECGSAAVVVWDTALEVASLDQILTRGDGDRLLGEFHRVQVVANVLDLGR